MYRDRSSLRVAKLVVLAVLAMAIMVPVASLASSEGNRNTALGLAGLSAYFLFNGKTTPGILSAAGAAIAYNNYQESRDRERFWDNRGYYYGGNYGRGWDGRDHRNNRDRNDHRDRDDHRDNNNWDRHR